MLPSLLCKYTVVLTAYALNTSACSARTILRVQDKVVLPLLLCKYTVVITTYALNTKRQFLTRNLASAGQGHAALAAVQVHSGAHDVWHASDGGAS